MGLMKGMLWLLAGVGLPVVLVMGLAVAAAAAASVTKPSAPPDPGVCLVDAGRLTTTSVAGFGRGGSIGGDNDQIYNAAIIVVTANHRGLSARDAEIGLMAAMQESTLRNVNYGDLDSLGLFQQRPSQGWGTPEQVRDPYYATNKFYDTLVKLTNRVAMSLTEAAQAVQRSAYPDAYAHWEADAAALLTTLTADPGAVCSFGSGMTASEADTFMNTYIHSDPVKWDVWSCDCSGGCLVNCVSFSIYFINRYTTSHIVKATGDGYDVVNRLLTGDICAAGDCGLTDGGHTPRPYAIFSRSTGVQTCGDRACGHTGVVLAVDPARDQILVGEAVCGNPGFTGAHTYRLSDWSTDIYTYAYTDAILKGDPNG